MKAEKVLKYNARVLLSFRLLILEKVQMQAVKQHSIGITGLYSYNN